MRISTILFPDLRSVVVIIARNSFPGDARGESYETQCGQQFKDTLMGDIRCGESGSSKLGPRGVPERAGLPQPPPPVARFQVRGRRRRWRTWNRITRRERITRDTEEIEFTLIVTMRSRSGKAFYDLVLNEFDVLTPLPVVVPVTASVDADTEVQ